MKITVIDNYDSFVFNLVRYLRELDGVTVEVIRNDSVDFDSISNSDGILLSPGPGIPEEAGELNNIIEQFADKKPMLGVCLGHQALALHFGGTLERCSSPIHGKASMVRKIHDSKMFQNIPDQFETGRYHSWKVSNQLPEVLTKTAQCDNEIMAMEHTKLPIYGVQFHPESILTPDGRTMISNWVEILKSHKHNKQH